MRMLLSFWIFSNIFGDCRTSESNIVKCRCSMCYAYLGRPECRPENTDFCEICLGGNGRGGRVDRVRGADMKMAENSAPASDMTQPRRV